MSLTQLVAANAAAAAAGAGKKAAQVHLQADLNTDDEWDKFIAREGLLVIDVYTEWCGPCIGMVGNLKKIKVELGGDNLHLAVAKADTIEVLKRFRNRSEPTWMFIAGGQLLKVVFGADAPRLARTIELELAREEEVRRGVREREQRAPHQLTPEEQVIADAEEKRRLEKQARELAALLARREARREARARRLEQHFADLCPVLMMPHVQKHLRKVADALEPFGVVVADKCPLLAGKEGAGVLCAEEPALASPAALAALAERPCLTLLLKKLPDREGEVVELVRRALCGDSEGAEGERSQKSVAQELTADGVPGLYVPADRHARAVALDFMFPKMVSAVAEPPAPPEPPHVALVYGAWQRRGVLAAAAAPDVRPHVLRYGFFADACVQQPRLLCKTIDQYEQRPEKDFSETLVLMVSVGPAAESGGAPPPPPPGPPAPLLALAALHVSEDALAGEDECRRFFPPGYSEPEHKPKPKGRKKKKKRECKEGAIDDATTEQPASSEQPEAEASGEAETAAEGEGEGEGEADGEGGEGDGEDEEIEGEGGVDKATSPPPQTPH